MILTRAQLRTLYGAINNSGRDNAQRIEAAGSSEERIQVALRVLGIEYHNLRYNDEDGYKFDATPVAQQMINRILANPTLLRHGIDHFNQQQNPEREKMQPAQPAQPAQATRTEKAADQPKTKPHLQRTDAVRNLRLDQHQERDKRLSQTRPLETEDYQLAAKAIMRNGKGELYAKAVKGSDGKPYLFCCGLVNSEIGNSDRIKLENAAMAEMIKRLNIAGVKHYEHANRHELLLVGAAGDSASNYMNNKFLTGETENGNKGIVVLRFDNDAIRHYANEQRDFDKRCALNQVDPVPAPGVSQQIGASVMLLLQGGPTREQAQAGKGIANIQMSRDGSLTLNIPSKDYAERLHYALRSLGYEGINLSNHASPLRTRFGDYESAVTIKDPAQVKRFVEETCHYKGTTVLETLYKVNNLNPADFNAAPASPRKAR